MIETVKYEMSKGCGIKQNVIMIFCKGY